MSFDRFSRGVCFYWWRALSRTANITKPGFDRVILGGGWRASGNGKAFFRFLRFMLFAAISPFRSAVRRYTPAPSRFKGSQTFSMALSATPPFPSLQYGIMILVIDFASASQPETERKVSPVSSLSTSKCID